MQNAGNCNSTGISVQHKFALRVRLRQGSCLNQSQFDGVESLLLLIPPGESRAQAGNSMQGGHKLGMPKNKLSIIVGEAQKSFASVLFLGTWYSGLIPSAETTVPGT